METPSYNLPKGFSVGRTILRSFGYLKDPIGTITGNMERFSGTYSATLPGKLRLVLTQDPVFIQYVLRDNHTNYQKSALTSDMAARYFGKGFLFSNGEHWRRQRRMVQPGFHREKLQGLYDIIVHTIDASLQAFPAGEGIDVYPLVYKISFDIIIHSLFELALPGETMKELSDTFNELQDFFVKEVNQPFRKLLYPFNQADRRLDVKRLRLRAIFQRLIDERRSSGRSASDLLDMLLSARYEDTGEPMSDDQLIDEIQVLVFAGHETTANTLSWLLYLLAENPAVADSLKIATDGIYIFESPSSPFMNAVINEGMRLFPAAWMTDRMAIKDDRFGDYSFPAGTIIIPFFYGLHRDAASWEAPDRFLPERFMTETGASAKPKNFLPFGAGPRMCIGNNFAMAEMSFFLYRFIRLFSVASTGQRPAPKPLLTLRPDKVVLNVQKMVTFAGP